MQKEARRHDLEMKKEARAVERDAFFVSVISKKDNDSTKRRANLEELKILLEEGLINDETYAKIMNSM